MKRVLFATSGWLAATVAAALVGLLALTLIGDELVNQDSNPMSQQEAADALVDASQHTAPSHASHQTSTPPPAHQFSSPSSPSPSSSRPARDPQPRTQELETDGGDVLARCDGSSVRLLSWTPRQGFDVEDNAVLGPGSTAYLKFESEEVNVPVTINCQNGIPVAHAVTQDDD